MAYNPSISIDIFKKKYGIPVSYALLLIIALSLFIRFYRLNFVGLWLDEIYSMTGSDPNTTLGDVYEYCKRDQPPLFFFLLHWWLSVFGYTDFSGRALACIIGALGVVSMYFLGREAKDHKVGLLAALITAINFFHTEISKEIRFYPLVFLLSALSFLFFIRCAKRPAFINFIFYALFTGLLLNTHYYGMVLFATQSLLFVVIAAFFNRSRHFIAGGLLSGVVAGLSLLHWLPVLQSDLQIEAFHIKPLTWTFPFDFAWTYIREPVAFGVYCFCGFLAARSFLRNAKAGKASIAAVIIVGWISIGLLIPTVYSLVRMPLLIPKYSTIIVPALFLAIAVGFEMIFNKKLQTYLVVITILTAFIILFYARPPHKPRRAEDWREVAEFFRQKQLDNAIVFSQLAWFHQYYFRKFGLTPPMDQNATDVVGQIGSSDAVWLLSNSRYTGGLSVNGFSREQQSHLELGFEKADSVEFKQTKAILYKKKNR